MSSSLSSGVLAFAEALAGAGGGVLSLSMFYPLQNVSTRMQVQKKEADKPSDAAAPVVTKQYSGTMQAITAILQDEGLAGLYRGLNSAVFGVALTQFVYYGCYSWVVSKAQQLTGSKELSVLNSLGAGAVAGALTATSTHPIWTVNTRLMASDQFRGKSAVFAFKQILSEEGISGLFQGLRPALILVVNPSIQFMVFQKLKDMLSSRRGTAKFSSADIFLLASIAKVAATLVTYPYILAKSQLQLKRDNTPAGGSRTEFSIVKETFAKEGLAGLYKGLNSKILQSVLTAAFLFLFQDRLKILAVRILKLILNKK
eukprot:TRINITY_DN3400_c0_g1_i1.p1 TRINITY_DN3400_c0_g1~~TRINITY_DN3400_c0_g1_i1.p1  ORF type:complete len:314 (+),score=82.48 TRINITY_DN3400_c0_g1_i1:58-999(+)